MHCKARFYILKYNCFNNLTIFELIALHLIYFIFNIPEIVLELSDLLLLNFKHLTCLFLYFTLMYLIFTSFYQPSLKGKGG